MRQGVEKLRVAQNVTLFCIPRWFSSAAQPSSRMVFPSRFPARTSSDTLWPVLTRFDTLHAWRLTLLLQLKRGVFRHAAVLVERASLAHFSALWPPFARVSWNTFFARWPFYTSRSTLHADAALFAFLVLLHMGVCF